MLNKAINNYKEYIDQAKSELINIKNAVIKEIELIPTHQNIVLKLKTDKENYFMKIFLQKQDYYVCEKIVSLTKLLQEKDIPVPNIISYSYGNKILDHPHFLMDEAKGIMLKDVKNGLSREDLKELFYDFGQQVAKIHSITFDKFGETKDGKIVIESKELKPTKGLNAGPFLTWIEMHKNIVLHRLSYFKNSSFEYLVPKIKNYFEKNSNLIDYNIAPRLLHIDLNQKNVFVKNNKISSIIDFDGSFIGHNEEELMRTASANFSDDDELRIVFFKGYTEILELDECYEKRKVFYYLSRLLVHIDCIILFGKSYKKDQKVTIEDVCDEVERILSGKEIDFNKNK